MIGPPAFGTELGILGSGLAGSAITRAAESLGWCVRTSDADCADLTASQTSPSCSAHASDSASALGGCRVVTAAVEHASARDLAALVAAGTLVRPAPEVVALAQHRVLERDWLVARGLLVVPWRVATSLDEALAALATFAGVAVLKPAIRRGPAADARTIRSRSEMETAWSEFGATTCVVEQHVDIETELSVVVARNARGVVAAYPPAESQRVDYAGVPRLLWSVIPARCPWQQSEKARRNATTIAERLHIEGLLAVEMFLLTDGRLVVNEIVPCAHPTYLPAEHACATDQNEQLVRAVCDLPLGSTWLRQPAAVAPIYRDSWSTDTSARIDSALEVSGVSIRLAGSTASTPGERVGHLVAVGTTPDEAIARATCALRRLTGMSTDGAWHPG